MFNSLSEPQHRDLNIYFVIDTSGSMEGSKISALNDVLKETITALNKLAKTNDTVVFKVAILEFNSDCRWITSNGPLCLDGSPINSLKRLNAYGMTNIGSALKELNATLDEAYTLNSLNGAFVPVIIFMTDGHPTDDYKNPLKEIQEKRVFEKATKIGFAIGDDADMTMIADVVGNTEAVLKTTDLELFKRVFQFATVTSSMVNSDPLYQGYSASGEDVIKRAKRQFQSDE